MQITFFDEAKEILERLESYNHKAYFVGGCVRDMILGRNIGDVDIATSASPESVQEIFDNVIPVGLQHGTVIVRHNRQSYEVTTFRTDGEYSDQRHPDSVTFIQSIDEDLQRRDFTINALAMDRDGTIIDLFQGKNDIAKKVIRTVGNGFERFQEDPLRIIRALRFSSQLGFSISDDTLDNMKLVKQEVETIAVERIKQEVEKFFAGKHVQRGIDYLKETQLDYHLPVFRHYHHLIHKLPDRLTPVPSFGAVTALFHYLKPEITIQYWSSQWKCSNREKRAANDLIRALHQFNHSGMNSWLVYCLPAACYPSFVILINLLMDKHAVLNDIMKWESILPIHSRQELVIDGNDVKQLFPDRSSGPWIKDVLNAVEFAVVTGKVNNNKKDLKEWIKWNPTAIN
ncbi:CCA tRNA nucleotidyltransferase [Virgibacillus ihumii]|uniref:CCA tRNA nucleotidyltransferase n=1 Tax=Virgibacillus ihumii TaxID=2686091 RepID=UPI00157D28B0|nr:CCA tRNA nucleotidyltransferase [Virgibacillus ihumii]